MRPLRSLVFFMMVLAGSTRTLLAAVVCNAGFPGENSTQVLRRLPNVLADCPQPTVAVLFVGGNDALNEQRFQTPEQTFASVSAILKSLADVHAHTLVVTMHLPDLARLMQRHTPESYGSRSPTLRLDDANAAVRKAAAEQGAAIIDFHEVLARAGGANAELSTDGVHLTGRGYHLLAATVASALPSSMGSGKVLCIGDSLTYGTGVRGPQAPDAGSDSYPQQLEKLLLARENR